MTDYYVSLPLYDDAVYSYAVSLEGNSYILEFTYNERCQLYFLSLFTADKEPILLGHALTPNYPMLKDYALIDLSGFFWMEEKADIISEPYKVYPDKIDQYYNLFYLWSED